MKCINCDMLFSSEDPNVVETCLRHYEIQHGIFRSQVDFQKWAVKYLDRLKLKFNVIKSMN